MAGPVGPVVVSAMAAPVATLVTAAAVLLVAQVPVVELAAAQRHLLEQAALPETEQL